MLRRDHEAGFTLVELAVAIAILGTVMSAIVVAMLLALKSTAEADTELGESGDLQFASVYFANDVQGSNTMASTGPAKCGTGTLVIDLAGPDFDPATLAPLSRIVSYVLVNTTTAGGSAVAQLHRLSCTTTAIAPTYPLTPTSDIKVADQLSATAPPTVACATVGGAVPCADSAAVTASLRLTEASGQQYVLSGTRRTSP